MNDTRGSASETTRIQHANSPFAETMTTSGAQKKSASTQRIGRLDQYLESDHLRTIEEGHNISKEPFFGEKREDGHIWV
jgi:hypothetical protein